MKNSRKLDDEERYETSLMITSVSLEYIKSIKKRYGKTYSSFLNVLVSRNIKFLKIKSNMGGKVLTEYQNEGLDLKKLNFRPRSKDWSVLRTVANHYNISISLLVALLLEMFFEKKENTNKNIVHVLNIRIFKKLINIQPNIKQYLQFSTIQI